jgi:hypothetical protein
MSEEGESYQAGVEQRGRLAERFTQPVEATTMAMLAFSRAAEVLAAAILGTYAVFMDTLRASVPDLCWQASDSGLCLLDRGHAGEHQYDPTPADTLFSYLGLKDEGEEGVEDGTDRS